MSSKSRPDGRPWVALALGLTIAFCFCGDKCEVPVSPAIPRPATPHLSVEVPEHQDYAGVCKQLEQWQDEAPGLAQVGEYGRSRGGKTLHYLRVGNQQLPRVPVLITACIHGNEPWSTSVVMSYAGRLLSQYGQDERITHLLDTTDIYIVPVVSPDSYPNSRHVDGVDPNRDFPGPHAPDHKSTPSIAALEDLFLAIHPKAAWSGHTYGRVFLTPYGDQTQPCPDDEAFNRLFDEMASLAHYEHKRACQLYGQPIHGSEVDWYYRNGAASCVCEYGTHQHAPSLEDTKSELERTWPAFLLFLEQAPGLLNKPL